MDRLLVLLLAALALFHAGVLAYHLGLVVAFPFDLNYGEGYVLNDAVRLSRGEPLYVDLQQFPMVRSPYPPLFPLVWSWLVPLVGPQLWPGRMLSVAALLGVCGLAAWNAARARAGRWPVLVAPALIAASPFVYQWAGFARVDLLALLFAAGGVLVAQWVPGWRGVLGAAVLCSLAIWTKQTALTAAVAVGLAWLLRDWRRALAFTLVLGAPSLIVLAVLNAQTDGQFARHVLDGNATNPFSASRAVYYLGTFTALHLPLVAAALWWLGRALRGRPSPVAVYLPVALLGSLSVGNAGSSVNYLLEPVIACALAVPFAWRAVPRDSARVAPLLAAVQLGLLVRWPNTFGTDYLFAGRTPTAADAAVGARVDSLVRAEPGAVIAEPAGFAVRNGRPVYVQPIDLRAEQVRGRWRSGPLVEALATGQFGLVVTAYDLFPKDAEQAIQAHFDLIESLPSPDGLTFRIYRYRREPG